MNVDDFSNLVFRLTNAAIEGPPDAHEAAQVEILRDVFPFDAAWWGWSNLSGGQSRLINTGHFGLPYSYDCEYGIAA